MNDLQFQVLAKRLWDVAERATVLPIPSHYYVAFTYYGSTNNIHTISYKTGGSGGTTVATVTYTYVGSGASNDDSIATITLT